MPLSKIVANSITDNTITTDQIADTSVHGRRNLIINGAMRVAQRGTSGTIAANGGAAYKSIDRWQLSNALDVTATIAQSSTAPAGFTNSLKITVGGADDLSGAYDTFQVQQIIEAQNLQHLKYGTSSAESLTLSFWVRSSVTGTYVVHLYQYDGADLIGGTYTISSANTWEYKTITFAGNTAAAPANDNGQGLRVTFILGAATEYTSGTLPTAWEAYTDADSAAGQTANVASSASGEWYLTGCQFEIGAQATPFDHSESYGETLAKCQRYYWQLSTGVHGNYPSWAATGYNTNQCNINLPFPVPMRTTPTASFNTGNVNYYRFYRGGSYQNFSNVATDTITSEHLNMYGDGISHTQGLNGTLQIRLADGAGVFVTAEL